MPEKKVTMTIRLHPVEKMRIKRWAKEAGQTLSDYVMEAVRERLAREEAPLDEKSDLDLVQSALRKEEPLKVEKKSEEELEKKSLSDLIKDYVNEDDTAF